MTVIGRRTGAALVAFFTLAATCVLSATPSPAQAAGTRFYFHKGTTHQNLADAVLGESTFDTTAPSDGSPGFSVQPIIGSAVFEGSIDETISSLTLDIWQNGAFFSNVNRTADYYVLMSVKKDGQESEYLLPQAQEDVTGNPPITRFQHTWTTMAVPDGPDEGTEDDIVPLNIDPRGGRVRIFLVSVEVNATVLYDSTDYPSNFTINAPAPEPTPTGDPTNEPPAGVRADFFFHSQTGNYHGDWAEHGASRYDQTRPTNSTPAIAYDIAADNTADKSPWDPVWTGTTGPIQTLKVDFWQKALFDDGVFGSYQYNVTVYVGEGDGVTRYDLPLFREPTSGDVPARVTHTFTTMLDAQGQEVPLSIAPNGAPVTINISNWLWDSVILFDAEQYPSGFSINVPPPDPTGPGEGQAPGANAPAYTNFSAPAPIGRSAAEPSIGVNRNTGNVFFQSYTETLRVNGFDDSTGNATWEDTAPPLTSLVSLDPILFTDPSTGRTFVSQLAAGCSLMAYTDDDGETWNQNPIGCGLANGADHQTVGGGAFSPDGPRVPNADYEHAVYYCSHAIVSGQCAASWDGGTTFNPAVPAYSLADCRGLHGHIKVGPDGTAYIPHGGCDILKGGRQAVVVSEDNGLTWSVRRVPSSTTQFESDPSLGVGSEGSIYMGWQEGASDAESHPYVAVSHDDGRNWEHITDVGVPYGIKNIQFPTVVAGDDDRAAFAFLGTTTGGDDQAADFAGVWHLYIATTYDGGETWTTVDATPNDPVQRGCIWLAGGDNPCRNLLDFNDITIDEKGRVLAAYADGCVGDCLTGATTKSAVGSIARQASGLGLLSAYDGQIVPTTEPTTEPTNGGDPPPDPNATARTARYYFHGHTGQHTLDTFADILVPGGIRFDESEPTGTKPGLAPDLPTDGDKQTMWDPHWKGTIVGHVRDVTVDFWAQPTFQSVDQSSTFRITLWHDANRIDLPLLQVPNSNGPVHVTHTFKSMLDASGNEVPLDVPAVGDFSINVAGRSDRVDAPVVLFDSVDFPSGFSINTEIVDPTPTTDPSPTATSPPSPTSTAATPSPSESTPAPPAPVGTEVSFTDASAAGAQYSDEARIEARLVDEDGAPISGADLTFELLGSSGPLQWSATTGDDGVAGKTTNIVSAPGSYRLTVRYAPAASDFEPSADVMDFVVDKEETVTALRTMGKGSNRSLVSRSSDHDSDAGLKTMVVDFLADGSSLGTAETDASGTATLALPARFRNGHHDYEAIMRENDLYLGSSDRRRT